jgi:hypothetical protein
MWFPIIINKSKFGFILRKCLNQKYLSDWKDTSESLKDGKLTTYLFLKTNFKLEKISHFLSDKLVKMLTLTDMKLKRSSLSPLNFGNLVRK